MAKIIKAADLFCGCGGSSAGLYDAADELGHTVDLLAINHEPIAIETHSHNHKLANHMCEDLDNVNPRRVIPDGMLDIMVASPECTHFSNARGGKPMDEQSRSNPWHVCRWLDALRVESVMLENVPEFQTWRPLSKDGKPDKRYEKGCTFTAFMNAIAGMGYRVEHRVLNAADYGDATARRRLFILAQRGNRKLRWPDPTHSADGSHGLRAYRTAREIIDWDHPSQSIFERKRPLVEGTMKRIEAGLRKFCSAELEPFLVMMYGTGSARNLDLPCPTVTADGNHIGLAQPFLVPIDNRSTEDGTRSADEPLGVVTTKARWCLAQPFVMHLTHQGAHGPRCHSVDNPLPTVTGANRGEMGLVEPFLVNMKGQSTASDIDKPAPTSTTRESLALVEPFLTKYYSTGQENLAHSINKPLDTVTTRERFGLCQPEFDGKRLDIKFRMLQPDELAAAMSLQRLEFKGTKKQIVKMIGNAVARRQARALCRALLAA